MDSIRSLHRDVSMYSAAVKGLENYIGNDTEPPDCDAPIKKFRYIPWYHVFEEFRIFHIPIWYLCTYSIPSVYFIFIHAYYPHVVYGWTLKPMMKR